MRTNKNKAANRKQTFVLHGYVSKESVKLTDWFKDRPGFSASTTISKKMCSVYTTLRYRDHVLVIRISNHQRPLNMSLQPVAQCDYDVHPFNENSVELLIEVLAEVERLSNQLKTA